MFLKKIPLIRVGLVFFLGFVLPDLLSIRVSLLQVAKVFSVFSVLLLLMLLYLLLSKESWMYRFRLGGGLVLYLLFFLMGYVWANIERLHYWDNGFNSEALKMTLIQLLILNLMVWIFHLLKIRFGKRWKYSWVGDYWLVLNAFFALFWLVFVLLPGFFSAFGIAFIGLNAFGVYGLNNLVLKGKLYVEFLPRGLVALIKQLLVLLVFIVPVFIALYFGLGKFVALMFGFLLGMLVLLLLKFYLWVSPYRIQL